jgi:hypothetical protein
LFSEKLNESPEVVQNALEALIYLMIETNRYQVYLFYSMRVAVYHTLIFTCPGVWGGAQCHIASSGIWRGAQKNLATAPPESNFVKAGPSTTSTEHSSLQKYSMEVGIQGKEYLSAAVYKNCIESWKL